MDQTSQTTINQESRKRVSISPGPWTCVQKTAKEWPTEKPEWLDLANTRHIYDKNGHLVARIDFVNPEADAPLITESTELLEALLVALPYVEDHEDSPHYKKGVVKKAVRQIREAIARATGDQS